MTEHPTDQLTLATNFARVVRLELAAQLGDPNLTPSAYATLVRADGRTASEIAALLGVTSQAVSKTLRDLRMMGYTTAAPGPDRRSHLIALTPRGRAVLQLGGNIGLPDQLVEHMSAYIAQHTAAAKENAS